ncbi:MAG: alpha/beta fold hydrolase [Acidobacteriaceae bacterium]|nr:alpha/beta fold hydrolase [Acidobacteriaceae bacterium]
MKIAAVALSLSLAVPFTAATAQTPAATATQASGAPVTGAVTGVWIGVLSGAGIQIHLVFHIAGTPSALTTTFDSPDQGATGLPTASTTLEGEKITIDAPKPGIRYTGRFNAEHTVIDGTLTQGGQDLSLKLLPATKAELTGPNRPQTPKPPFPYRAEDVSFTNATAGDTLAATLTLPPGKGPFPAVLLIAGSGPQHRDEEIFHHKPMALLADTLTRRGFAVLRYDKRGTGKSTGDFRSATTQDFASDADAALAYLRSRPEIETTHISLLGHSEGGVIAPILAAEHPQEINAIVLLAGPGLQGSEVISTQVEAITRSGGANKEQVDAVGEKERKMLAIDMKPATAEARRAALEAVLAGQGGPEQIAGAIAQLTSPWFLYYIAYDPAPTLRRVQCPVLALDGSLDAQVVAAPNLAAIRAALQAGGNHHVEAVEMPGLNHLFQHAESGSPTEYATIEETMSPEVLAKVSDWLLAQPPVHAAAK